MGEPAQEVKTVESNLDGLEQFFEAEVIHGTTTPCEGGPTDGVPVQEAAKILGLSIKTVKDRLRKGTLSGFKIKGRFGDKWMVRVGTDYHGAPMDNPWVPGGSSLELVATTASDVELVGPTNEQDRLIDAYKEQLKELQNKLDAATFRLGYLEHERETHIEKIKLLTDEQHKASWWKRFCAWFQPT